MGEDRQAERTMGGMARRGEELPAVKGFFQGEEILFVHPEASDAEAAEMLTEMMGSPVLVVPTLADVPDSALARVFVFRNGVKGDGPMGYQSDVFDSAPGSGNYTPLRGVHFVSWPMAPHPCCSNRFPRSRRESERESCGLTGHQSL